MNQQDYKTRVNETKNPVGRPPGVPEKAQEALPDSVLPSYCPHCGRAQQPRIESKRPSGERDCTCALCGKGFVYSPAMVRRK